MPEGEEMTPIEEYHDFIDFVNEQSRLMEQGRISVWEAVEAIDKYSKEMTSRMKQHVFVEGVTRHMGK